MMFTYDQQEKLPTYIRLSEPVQIEGLRLNQVPSYLEYFLVTEPTETETKSISATSKEDTSGYPFMALFIAVPVLVLVKRRIAS